jgi:hypothetical protein
MLFLWKIEDELGIVIKHDISIVCSREIAI